jgi:hypothetical protein
MDFDWIKNTEFDFGLKVFYWEPMAEFDEYIDFCKFISKIDGNDSFQWTQAYVRDYQRWNPFEDGSECIFIHHVLTNKKGKAYWGGIDISDYYELEDDGIEEYDMIYHYEPYRNDAENFEGVEREWIDARRFIKLKSKYSGTP